MEPCLEGSDIGHNLVVALRPPFKRLNNSFRRIGSVRRGCRDRPSSLVAPDVIPKCEDSATVNTSGEGPAAWATSFEKLLECPVGLHTFAEFLKKEFSAENIFFWTACERFRKLGSPSERSSEAQRIYQNHLRVGASEAVNVDSQARQYVEQSLRSVGPNLFLSAQKQIFNLMKFDSYSRFLKSDLYKQCLAGNCEQQRLDPNLLLAPASPTKLKKSLSNAEDRRRKSLLPWHRKNRSKSKDRGETEYNGKKCDVNENISEPSCRNSEGHSSKSSLTSLDLAVGSNNDSTTPLNHDQSLNPGRHPLCRVKLTNGSMVVQIKEQETIHQLVNRLLEKRGINYSCYEVFTDKQTKALNVSDPSYKLAGCEVDVQQRVTFRLDLPNKKVIAVKSKSTKILVDVLRPILSKYSYTLEEVTVSYNNEFVDVNLPVTSVDTMRLLVQLNNLSDIQKLTVKPTLDEITNRVYEDILQEKGDTGMVRARSDRESVKSEDWGSEHSSGLLNRFLKRDSERNRERKKKLVGRSKGNSAHSSIEDVAGDHVPATITCKKPLIAKLKAGVKIQNTSESEELYEGLSRAQRSRLEDQRGTEINFELPDFLKENEKMETSKFYTGGASPTKPEPAAAKNLKLELHSNYENRSFINNLNVYPPNKYLMFDTPPPIKLEEKRTEGECSAKLEPPPLPPKPKILPIKPSNWKQRDAATRKGLYLEQPTSSFV